MTPLSHIHTTRTYTCACMYTTSTHTPPHYTHLSYLSPPFLCVSVVTTSACYFLLTYSYHSTNSHHAPTQGKQLTFTLCSTFPHLVVLQLYVSCSCAWQLFFEYWLSGHPRVLNLSCRPLVRRLYILQGQAVPWIEWCCCGSCWTDDS